MFATQIVHFGTVDIRFDDRVLAPRPWTIAQSEWAAALSPSLPAGPILELGCGAGHIGLAAAALTGRRLVQVDMSEVACEWARQNAQHVGLGDAVTVRCADVQDALAPDERFPLVLVDPPYVPSDEVARFPEDPVLAIDGGEDGLCVMRAFLRAAADHAMEGGAVLCQTRGVAQARRAAALAAAWLSLVEVRSFADDRAVALLTPSVTTV